MRIRTFQNEIQLLWHKALLRGGAGTAPAMDSRHAPSLGVDGAHRRRHQLGPDLEIWRGRRDDPTIHRSRHDSAPDSRARDVASNLLLFFVIDRSERANATKGDVESIRTGWAAVLQLTVDKNRTVWQIDLSLPGHTCTIAASDRDARNALQEFQFDGSRLRVKGKGSHDCDMTSRQVPSQRFEWDIDFETSVIEFPGPP